MALRSTMKYFYFGIGVFTVYGIVTVNILSWVGNQYKLPPQPGNVQGTIRNSGEINTTAGSYVLYDTLPEYQEELPSLSEIEEQNRVMFENSMKRKRKILAEIIQDYHKSKVNFKEQKKFRFASIGNISFFSAFYDDRENLDLDSPVIRMISIAPLVSTEIIVCRYTNNGIDSWILAQKFEMCENHDKVYGGFMFLCKLPKDVDIVPKKIYIKSLNDLEESSHKGNDSSISLDILPIKRKRVGKMMYQYDGMFDDYDSLSPYVWEDRQSKGEESNHINRKLLNIHNSAASSSNKSQNSYNGSPHSGNTRQILQSNTNDVNTADSSPQKPTPFELAACIPPLFGTIQLSSFIQFMEFLKIQKVYQVFVYVMTTSKEMEVVLQYYENQGFLIKIQWDLPDQIKGSLWNNGQIATIQDCLYRTMGNFDYVAFLDIDEIIIPKTSPDWQTMLQRFQKEYHSEDYSEIGGYRFSSAFFDPQLADTDQSRYKLSFLKSVYRTRTYSQRRAKLLVQPEFVTEMGIHHISQPLMTFYNVTAKDVAVETASIHHFRPCTSNADERMVCADTMKDKSILKFAERLNRSYQQTVKYLMNIMKLQ